MTTPPPLEEAGRSAATDDALARRYGGRAVGTGTAAAPRPGGRRLAGIGSAVVAVVIGVGAVVFTLQGTDPVATAEALTFTVTADDTVEVVLAVTRPDPATAVTCSVEALDATTAQVGVAVVTVPPGDRATTTLSVDVTTLARAENARALDNSCFPLQEEPEQ